MSVDIVHDLELDQDPAVPTMLEHGVPPTPQMLEELRTYLSSYYQVSKYVYATDPLHSSTAPLKNTLPVFVTYPFSLT